MNSIDNKLRDSYLTGNAQPLTTESSILISSSKFLNSARLRDVVAHEALRKNGLDLPTTYLLPELAQAINEQVSYEDDLAAIHRERKLKPEFATWLDERFLSELSIEEIKDCAPGTLGNIVYQFAVRSGMDIAFQTNKTPIKDDLQYYTRRSYQCHDVEHLVTGFEPNPYGESALVYFKAYLEGNYLSPEVAQIIHRALLSATALSFVQINLHYPVLVPHIVEAMHEGISLAKKCKKQLLYIKWEDYWDVQLHDVREELGLQDAPPPGKGQWMEDASRG